MHSLASAGEFFGRALRAVFRCNYLKFNVFWRFTRS
jgi:hypothetical protein